MRIALIQMPVLPDKVKNIQTGLRQNPGGGQEWSGLRRAAGDVLLPLRQQLLRRLRRTGGRRGPDGPVPPGSGAGALPRGRDCAGAVGGPDLQHQLRLRPRRPPAGQARKAHLFDIDVQGGQRFRESDTLSPGNAITTFETAFGTMGLCVCFDLRFEELARCMCLRGAKVIFVPAAFNMTTGPRPLGTSLPPAGSGQPVLHRGGLPRPGRTGLLRGLRQLHRRVPGAPCSWPAGGGGDNPVRGPGRGTAGGGTAQLPILSARRTDLYEVREK